MLDRAWKAGIDASFVLFDSWFACDKIISAALDIGYGVICRLKRDRTKYIYEGKAYSLKQLWKTVAKKKTKWIAQSQVNGICLNVSLPKSGNVRLLFISDGKKKWQTFLSTDLMLEASEIMDYYARRWAIEVFFKDAKQMLYLGKEQSNHFDAAIACYSIVMVRYLLLVYVLNKNRLSGPIGPLFREISDNSLTLFITDKFVGQCQKNAFVNPGFF
jgi:IS4 transposase